MSPKEKAMDIFNKMCNSVDELLPLDVKECALIAVHELMIHDYLYEEYWFKVKKELKKL